MKTKRCPSGFRPRKFSYSLGRNSEEGSYSEERKTQETEDRPILGPRRTRALRNCCSNTVGSKKALIESPEFLKEANPFPFLGKLQLSGRQFKKRRAVPSQHRRSSLMKS